MRSRPGSTCLRRAPVTAAAVVALGLNAVQEQPFGGPMQVLPTPLEALLAALPAA